MVCVQSDSAESRRWILLLCLLVGELDKLFWESFSEIEVGGD